MVTKKIICAALVLSVLPLAGCENKKKTEEAVSIKWYIPLEKQSDIKLVNDEVNKITMEKLGVNIDMQLLDGAAYKERMNMNMASGDDYDICWIGYLNPFDNAVAKGGLMKLDELLEKTPELKNSIPDYAWEQCKYKGDTYIVPNLQIASDTMAVFFKKELVEKYNFDITTVRKTQDLEPFLQIIAENEPSIYPFSTGSGVASFRSLDEKENRNGEALVVAVKDEATGKFVARDGLDYADTKGRAKILWDWYQKGYIRKDIASVMDEGTDMRAGKYACWVSGWKPGIDAVNAKKYGYDVVSIKISPSYRSVNGASGAALAIGRNSKHPEEAIKFIELLNTDKELYNLICFGIEEKHYKKLAENRVELVDNSGYIPNACWKFGNQFNAYLLPGQDDNVWEETKKLNETAISNGLESFRFDKNSIKGILAKLDNVVNEYKVVRQGNLDPDTYWDEYKKKLYDNGLQTYIDEYQKQLDEFLNNK